MHAGRETAAVVRRRDGRRGPAHLALRFGRVSRREHLHFLPHHDARRHRHRPHHLAHQPPRGVPPVPRPLPRAIQAARAAPRHPRCGVPPDDGPEPVPAVRAAPGRPAVRTQLDLLQLGVQARFGDQDAAGDEAEVPRGQGGAGEEGLREGVGHDKGEDGAGCQGGDHAEVDEGLRG
ncbi:hypothetical protein DFJ74DRAFT_764669, partial [Hyaloraphidium curvatum]